jgi:hypothetical protein
MGTVNMKEKSSMTPEQLQKELEITQKNLPDLKGQIRFSDGYDHKTLREVKYYNNFSKDNSNK